MNLRKSIVFLTAGLMLAFGTAMPQEDAQGCKDHPLFSRMPNFYIESCETKEFDSYEFKMADENTVTVEGAKTYLCYYLKEGSKLPSELQVMRNYANAIKKIGGELLYQGAYDACLRLAHNGQEVWAHVSVWSGGESYTLTIIEKKEMVQDITASDILDALNSQGFIALDIHFDTNQATIKPESKPIVDQIAALLQDNPSLKVSIEGHTDNTGTPQSNKTLSQKRAEAVVSAMVQHSIDANRLSAVGWGQEKPVADNRTEEGRAKNRRVEVVKK